MKTGIYKIRNLINGKVYYGSTKRTFDKRRQEHFGALRYNRHSNDHIQNAWNKYGEEAFEFSIELECAADVCREIEQLYLDRHWDHGLSCYNIAKIASPDRKASEETRRKIGSAGQHPQTEETKQRIAKQNRGRKKPNNKSGYAGVSWSKSYNAWVAEIWIMSKKRYLGQYNTPEEASLAYNRAFELVAQGIDPPYVERPNKYGHPGIYKNGNGWGTAVRLNNKRTYLGTFPTPEEAHQAYVAGLEALLSGQDPIGKSRKNQFGYTGVVKQRQRYAAVIIIKHKLIRLGSYKTAEEAGQAYETARRKLL